MKPSIVLVFVALFAGGLKAEPPLRVSASQAKGTSEVNRLQSYRENDSRGKRSFDRLETIGRENQARLEQAKAMLLKTPHGQGAPCRVRSQVHVVSLENQNRMDEAQIAAEEEYLEALVASDPTKAEFVAGRREAIAKRREIMTKRSDAIAKLQTNPEGAE